MSGLGLGITAAIAAAGIADAFGNKIDRARIGQVVWAFMPVAGNPPRAVPKIQWRLNGAAISGETGVSIEVPDAEGTLSWTGTDSLGAAVESDRPLRIVQPFVAPVLTLTDAPSAAGIGAVVLGETVSQVLARLSDVGAAVTSGPGAVTIAPALIVSGAVATTLSAGDRIEAVRFTYSAPEAGDLVREVAANIVVGRTGPPPFVVAVFGQSQPSYLVDHRSNYHQIDSPVPADGNVVAFTQAPNGPVIRRQVTRATVAAKQVNPTVAAWSAWFAHVMPGREIVVVDLCEGGTGRGELMDDANSRRKWSDLADMVEAVRAEYDDIDMVVECWMANDAPTAKRMGVEWAPFYIGQRWGGGAFELGTANPDSTRNASAPVDHCLWDIEAPSNAFGRGIFKRDRTKWSIVGWPSFNSQRGGDAEMVNFSSGRNGGYTQSVDVPARDSLTAMFDDPRFQTFAGYDGFSSHLCRMTDASANDAGTHPSVLSPDGQILMGWAFAASIARAAGLAVEEPRIAGIETAEDGGHVDLLVDLPNGGVLTTLREQRAWIDKAPTLADVEALRLDPARTGCRVPDAALKVLGTDPLPAGFVWEEASRQLTLPANETAEALRGWDLRDSYLELRGTLTGGIVDCRLSARTTQATSTVIDIYSTATIGAIEWNTIEGQGYRNIDLASLVNERFEADGAGGWRVPVVGRIARNAFLCFPNDCIKAAHAGEICANYVDVPTALKSVPAPWDAGTTYAALDPVLRNGRQYVSRQDGNSGTPPSGTEADNPAWRHVDPHSDFINPRAVVGERLEIWGNFLNMAHDQRRVTDAGEPWGMTNAIRMDRNTSGSGLAVEHREVHAHRNVISTMGPETDVAGQQVSYPLSLGDAEGQPGWEPNRAEGNWITRGANGRWTRDADVSPNVLTGTIDYDRTTTASPATPHQQIVTGFEIDRADVDRRPAYRLDAAGYPESHRAGVVIADAGSGTPRRGRVRITPERPFVNGDRIEYLRGDASAILLEPRDTVADLWADMLIEHVPAFHDPTASHPMPGLAVRPQPAAQRVSGVAVPVEPEEPFVSRGAVFDGASVLLTQSASVPATAQGLVSMWLRNDEPTWEGLRFISEARFGTKLGFDLRTSTAGRLRLDLGVSAVNFYAGPTNATPFAPGEWYHLLMGWDGDRLTIFVNGVETVSQTITQADMAGSAVTQFAAGSRIAKTKGWQGALAYMWFAPDRTLDLTVAANRARFVEAGRPVDLGPDGAGVTGTAPAWYLDGDGAGWGNRGTGGALTLTGAMTGAGTVGY